MSADVYVSRCICSSTLLPNGKYRPRSPPFPLPFQELTGHDTASNDSYKDDTEDETSWKKSAWSINTPGSSGPPIAKSNCDRKLQLLTANVLSVVHEDDMLYITNTNITQVKLFKKSCLPVRLLVIKWVLFTELKPNEKFLSSKFLLIYPSSIMSAFSLS